MNKIIEVAITQIGKQEIPKGSNWGVDVQKYLASVGINFPASWCMSFVFWCANAAYGTSNVLLKTGGVLNQWNKIPSQYKFTTPEPGDIFIQDHGHGLGHTGIIERIENGILHTIEGNTNDTGSREGYEVCRKERDASHCVGFIRIPEPQIFV